MEINKSYQLIEAVEKKAKISHLISESKTLGLVIKDKAKESWIGSGQFEFSAWL